MKKLQPFLKAVAPAVLSLAGALLYSLANGRFDRTSVVIAAVGLVGATVTYFVPNAQPEVRALEGLFVQPSGFAPASALKPETPPATPPAA